MLLTSLIERPKRGGLLRVEIEVELRRVLLAVGPHIRQQLVLGGHLQKLIACGRERLVALAVVVLQIEIEPSGIPEVNTRRRREGEHARASWICRQSVDWRAPVSHRRPGCEALRSLQSLR